MRIALRALLATLGASAVTIALSIAVLGAAATALAGEHIFDLISGWRGPASPPWPSTMDSELRFYAAFWAAYGVLLLLAARNIAAWSRQIPWLVTVFFAGGVGRVASYLTVGPPHPFFVSLMVIELGLPPILILLWLGQARGQAWGPCASVTPGRR